MQHPQEPEEFRLNGYAQKAPFPPKNSREMSPYSLHRRRWKGGVGLVPRVKLQLWRWSDYNVIWNVSTGLTCSRAQWFKFISNRLRLATQNQWRVCTGALQYPVPVKSASREKEPLTSHNQEHKTAAKKNVQTLQNVRSKKYLCQLLIFSILRGGGGKNWTICNTLLLRIVFSLTLVSIVTGRWTFFGKS